LLFSRPLDHFSFFLIIVIIAIVPKILLSVFLILIVQLLQLLCHVDVHFIVIKVVMSNMLFILLVTSFTIKIDLLLVVHIITQILLVITFLSSTLSRLGLWFLILRRRIGTAFFALGYLSDFRILLLLCWRRRLLLLLLVEHLLLLLLLQLLLLLEQQLRSFLIHVFPIITFLVFHSILEL
jgi:hypothetical protein